MNTKIYIPSDDAHEGLIKAPNLSWKKIAAHYPPSNGIDDWRGLHKSKHWRKFYSAYELAVSWETADPFLPREIQGWFGDYHARLLAVIPEHKTPLPGGSRPSQSDALVFVNREGEIFAIAVEGKVHESFGPTVGEWRKNESKGKKKRLEFICQTLGLPELPANEIHYQLLHRAASAVIEAERFNADCAAMLVHSFAYKRGQYKDAELFLFRDFEKFLNPFGIHPAKQNAKYKTDYPKIPLYFGWVSL